MLNEYSQRIWYTALVLSVLLHTNSAAPLPTNTKTAELPVEASSNVLTQQEPITYSTTAAAVPVLSTGTSAVATQPVVVPPSLSASAGRPPLSVIKSPTVGQSKRPSIMGARKIATHHRRPAAVNVTKTRTVEEIRQLTRWMEEFGYLDDNSGEVDNSDIRFSNALRKVQEFANITISGEADDDTMAVLTKPRCGERDIIPAQGRHKRYILLNTRWQTGRQINIQFRNYTPDMTVDEQETIMQHVIDEWNTAADARLVFHPRGEHIESPEINIFHTRYDNRGRPFRPYGVLAYAALPTNGDMYFDDTERWAEFHINHPFTFSYLSVALHEMGHSLGLAHSREPSAVMFPYYGATRHHLTPDDIAGAIALFGPT